jgi:hypothetical protein
LLATHGKIQIFKTERHASRANFASKIGHMAVWLLAGQP